MATDGRLVFAIFANGDLAAVNFNGSIAWARNLGAPQNPYGHAASLAVWRDKLIVQLDQGDNKPAISRLTLFEAATGKLVWEQPRQVPSSWASPIVVEAAGKTQIITAGLPWLAAYSFADGAELWKAEVLEGEVTPSPILAGGLVCIANPNSTLIAVRPDGAGDVTKTHVAWACEENVPDSSSPTSNGEVVFYASSVGMGTCLDAKTGRKLWEHDFGTGIHASPGIAGSRVYVVSTDGHGWVLQAGREYKELGRGALNDKFYASPAFAGGRIYLRGNASLYCIGEK
jgi:outer membrane protein assembly factor BamB